MPCAEFTSAQLTSHRASRYGARLARLRAVGASSPCKVCWAAAHTDQGRRCHGSRTGRRGVSSEEAAGASAAARRRGDARRKPKRQARASEEDTPRRPRAMELIGLPPEGERATPSLAGNAHQDADGKPAREHERAAVRKERQRDSCDRHEIQRHADVDEHVHKPARHQSECDQTAVGIICSLGYLRDAEEQPEKKRQHDCHAEKAELFSHDREDEIRVLLRKERQTLLRSLREALAEKSTGTDRNL